MRLQPRFVFQYFSDLHLERMTKIPRISQTADQLILAGDIGYPQSDIYREFMRQCSEKYEHVFLVHGNHEWDQGSPLKYRYQLPANVHLLENDVYTVVPEKLSILGCTLWTPFTRPKENLRSIQFLRESLSAFETPQHRVVCVTHFLPSFGLIDRRYHRLPASVHRRYANHLETFMILPFAPQFWICGHSHSIVERRIGQTHCRINTYPERYDSTITVHLEAQ